MPLVQRIEFDAVPGEPVGAAVAAAVRTRLEPRRDEMARTVCEYVSVESPTDDPPGLRRMAALLGEDFAPFGRVAIRGVGPGEAAHLGVEVAGATALPPALVLCHYDTVWPIGTLARLPARVSEGVLRGPGCYDMKAGIVQLRYALGELRALGRLPRRRLLVLLTCDEEEESPTSRALIEACAAEAGVAFVLESSLPGGALKTTRKGTGRYRLLIQGRAAHAGTEPEKGASAILELAHQIRALHALNDPSVGRVVNVGVVRGGTRANVVAAEAEAEINYRTTSAAEAAYLDAAVRGLRPVVPGVTFRVEQDSARLPMERTEAVGRLFARARAIAAGMGVDLGEGGAGGASDGNLVAALGVPTLDGLGAEGGGAHSDREHVNVESLPRRAALLAGLLAEV